MQCRKTICILFLTNKAESLTLVFFAAVINPVLWSASFDGPNERKKFFGQQTKKKKKTHISRYADSLSII